MYTDNVLSQHRTILSIVQQMAPLLTRPSAIDQATADRLRKLLVELSSQVTIHLATEDKVIYPKLLQNGNPKVVAIASRFAEEMGGIGVAFKDYLSHWRNGQMIQTGAVSFCQETRSIASALKERIDREERELYPLVE